MTDFGDRMMDFIFEHDVAEDRLTGEQYIAALAYFPGEEFRAYEFFREWIWSAWCAANLPEPEIDEAETARVVEAAWQQFQAMLKK